MRACSAAMIKGGSGAKLDLPTEGTPKRFVYDYLYEKRGLPLSDEDAEALYALIRSPSGHSALKNIITELQDYWGCDIKTLGKKRWMLVGEWCGRVYLDYTGPAESRASRPDQLDGAFFARFG